MAARVRTPDELAWLLCGGHEEGSSICGTSDCQPQEGGMNWNTLGMPWKVPEVPGGEAHTSILC